MPFSRVESARLDYHDMNVRTRSFGVGPTGSFSSNVFRISSIDGLSSGFGCMHLRDISMHVFICW